MKKLALYLPPLALLMSLASTAAPGEQRFQIVGATTVDIVDVTIVRRFLVGLGTS